VITPQSQYVVVLEITPDRQVVGEGISLLGTGPVSRGYPLAESPVDAVRACRMVNSEWYAVTYLDATPEDIMSIAQYIEALRLHSVQFYTTDEELVLRNNLNSIFARLKAKNFQRSLGMFSRTPNAVCGILGYAMGANTRMSRSVYTLMHKTVTGIVPENLTETQLAHLKRNSANYYIARGYDDEYYGFENGEMANRTWFDEVINLDMLVNDMQLAIIDLFKNRPKVPQTESGVNEIKLAIRPCLIRMRTMGFIASKGKWNGPSIYIGQEPDEYAPLEMGDMLDNGFMIISEPVDFQPPQDRDARIAPPIYVAIKLAGAIHHVAVRIDVDR
jgi:hypothetical protein